MKNGPRKNPPKRKGRRITFQVTEEMDQAIRAAAEDEFPMIFGDKKLSALLRKAVELYLAEYTARKKGS